MRDKNEGHNMSNINVSRNTIHGNGDIIVGSQEIIIGKPPTEIQASYEAEPVWRSPITLGILSWLGFIFIFLDVGTFYNLIKVFMVEFPSNSLSSKSLNNINVNSLLMLLFILIICILLTLLFFWLKNVVKKELRIPIFKNIALKGKKNKITIEKIIPGRCPVCGGKMKYYNKPTEIETVIFDNGKISEKVSKREPYLECIRNEAHSWYVDPAEDKLSN